MEQDISSCWSNMRLFYLFMWNQPLISKPRNTWPRPRRPRPDIKSSCPPLWNPQNTNQTPAACSTPPPAARRPPHLKVSLTHNTCEPNDANQPDKNLGVTLLKRYSAFHRSVHPDAISCSPNELSVPLLCLYVVCSCVCVCVFSYGLSHKAELWSWMKLDNSAHVKPGVCSKPGTWTELKKKLKKHYLEFFSLWIHPANIVTLLGPVSQSKNGRLAR